VDFGVGQDANAVPISAAISAKRATPAIAKINATRGARGSIVSSPRPAFAMTETRTLQFESARVVQSLYANDLKLLKTLEDSLGVKVTTRDGWIKLEGEAEQLDRAQRVFEQLEQARQKGMDIHKHEFSYALNAVTESRSDSLNDVVDVKITTSSRKPPIMARTIGQRNYVEAIQKHDIVFGIGPAGTGKTYLAVAMAVAALKKEQVSRIILTRPAVEAGEALGFLPGDLQEKITPYLRPLYDSLRDMLDPEEIERAVARQTIEVAPLAYMRGRTLSNAFVILDEAQNTTTEQMFMLLTRMGPNSKCVVTGDVTQIDLPSNKRSGLVEALQALKNVPGISFVYFNERDVVRHELVRAVINAYQVHRSPAIAGGNSARK
jgi:phosphate starvation-inducible PhoH-like protein